MRGRTMNVKILKRIAALESKAAAQKTTPDLLMIFYDEDTQQWKIAESYTSGIGKNRTFKRKEHFVDRLQDYTFPAVGNPSVILDTFASPDPEIYGNLFCFALEELRQNMEPGDTGAFSIEAIREPEDGKIICEIVVQSLLPDKAERK